MQIERIEEYNLTAEIEAQINTVIERAFNESYGGRTFFQQRHNTRFIARDNGKIVGHMALSYRAMRMGDRLINNIGLAEVATDPDHQGRGIATTLLKATIAEARASQADFYTLFGVRPLYAGHGFRAVPNATTHVRMYGARTSEIATAENPNLMVMQLRDIVWDDTAHIDLLGFSF